MSNQDIQLLDTHCHTELAYCAEDITAAAILDVAQAAGLAGQCFTEHAPQLYCSDEDFWAQRHLNEPEIWRARPADRMGQLRALIDPLRPRCAAIGLEVEADRDGCLTVHDDDRDWADYLLGAVHWLPGEPDNETDYAKTFLACCRALIEGGVAILAHPLRRYHHCREGYAPPGSLLDELADMLAEHRVAAEVNYHINTPDEPFFARCLNRGVKIALASDAHNMTEVARFEQHLAFVRRLTGKDDIAKSLYQLPNEPH